MRAGRLYRPLPSSDFELMMDDEKIFAPMNESVSINRGFRRTDSAITTPESRALHQKRFNTFR